MYTAAFLTHGVSRSKWSLKSDLMKTVPGLVMYTTSPALLFFPAVFLGAFVSWWFILFFFAVNAYPEEERNL